MKFIHLSDLHFHRKEKDNVEVDKTLDFIRQNYSDHYVIITGDVVNDGHEDQYEQASKSIRPFLGRVFLCPGNHDFGFAGNFYDKKFAKRFDEYLMKPFHQNGTFSNVSKPVINTLKENNDQIMLIALDTNLETDIPFDFACGEVGDEQLSALNSALTKPDSTNWTKILFFHHHPFIRSDFTMELKDAKKLKNVIKNKVDVVLFGHKHDADMWVNRMGIQYMLASNNSPGKGVAREITVENKGVTVKEIPIN